MATVSATGDTAVLPIDLYQEALACNLYSMRISSEIINRTLKLNQDQEAVAESTHYEQNFNLVNITV